MKRFHQIPQYLRDDIHPITIDVVGVGGTGSYVLPKLAQLHLYLLELGFQGLKVTAYDAKNILDYHCIRQNFTPADVGENKAICMIEKLNQSYDLDWEGNPFNKKSKASANITISCTDSAKFRNEFKLIDKGYDSNKSFYWLDCGNGRDFGQIILGSMKIKQPKDTDQMSFTDQLKTVTDIYGDITQYEFNQGFAGCSARASVHEQGMFNNSFIANLVGNMLYDLLINKLIDYHGIIYNLTDSAMSKFYL